MSDLNYLCRLCSTNVKRDGMSIFGDRGKRSFLQSKIKLYLHFSVAENDDLPKILCTSCFRKLESIHRFASMALCMQDRLRSRLGLQALQNSDVPSPLSLLQSVQSAHSTQSAHMEQEEGKKAVESDCEVMEMEINPMTILYPGDESNSCTADENPDEHQENQQNLEDSSHPKMPPKKFHVVDKQKPHVCMYCSRGFVLELSLWNHLWLHKDRSHSKLSRLKHNSAKKPNKRGRKKKTENRSLVSNTPGETEEAELETVTGEQNNMETDTGDQSKVESGTEEEQNGETEPKRTEGLENNLCGVCRKNFESQSELETHLTKHHLEGKFGCSICSRVFRSKESLEQHETNHKVRDYICNECGRVYSTKSTLNSHLVTHSDVRPHKCALCPKTFKRNQDLKVRYHNEQFHLNQHTGERPYLCPFCPKAFASSGNCFSHRKRMHPQENEQIKLSSGFF